MILEDDDSILQAELRFDWKGTCGFEGGSKNLYRLYIGMDRRILCELPFTSHHKIKFQTSLGSHQLFLKKGLMPSAFEDDMNSPPSRISGIFSSFRVFRLDINIPGVYNIDIQYNYWGQYINPKKTLSINLLSFRPCEMSSLPSGSWQGPDRLAVSTIVNRQSESSFLKDLRFLSSATLNTIKSGARRLNAPSFSQAIIDGTNVIMCENSGTANLEILLAITSELKERGIDFLCFFDASTRYKLKDDQGEMYRNILEDRNNFIEVPGGTQADEPVVQYGMKNPDSVIISNDQYRDYLPNYGIADQESFNKRRSSILCVRDRVTLKKLSLDVAIKSSAT